MRVVSCVPSLSELAEELLHGCLVGRTRYCIAPESNQKLPKIGGTKDLDTDRIIRMQPDLVLSVKEENEKDQIECLQNAGLQVEIFDIRRLQDAIAMVEKCGILLQNPGKADVLASAMRRIGDARPPVRGSVLYFIWQKPLMVAGEDTFIGDLLRLSGFQNLAPAGARYPLLPDIADMQKLKPDYIFLSSEPYPFRDKHRSYFQNIFPESAVFCVDGSIFSWYGSRTSRLPDYLSQTLKIG